MPIKKGKEEEPERQAVRMMPKRVTYIDRRRSRRGRESNAGPTARIQDKYEVDFEAGRGSYGMALACSQEKRAEDERRKEKRCSRYAGAWRTLSQISPTLCRYRWRAALLRRQARIARPIFCWVNSSPQMPFDSRPGFPVAVGRCCCIVARVRSLTRVRFRN